MSPSRNPYHRAGNPPTLRRSVFVFMDILGYENMMARARGSAAQQTELRRLHAVLSDARSWLEGQHLPEPLRKMGRHDLYALKAFTDNIVIGWPVHDDAEAELAGAFSDLAAFQLRLAMEGYFIRGAISVGDAYVDEIAVFGEALIEAYDGERKLARDPRIILTESAVAAVKHCLTYYANPARSPHAIDVRRDADGQWFLNYLEEIVSALDEAGPFYAELAKHKTAVEAKLEEHASNPTIWSKYVWVANYHNYFCGQYHDHFSDEHLVRVDPFRGTPGPITED